MQPMAVSRNVRQECADMKKLMLLGGTRFVLPAIEAAHSLGVHVITCDYLPDNYAHKFSDQYCNVSVVDQEAVLKAAMDLQIDGILSYASDAGAVCASYVAQEMGLPGNPYESVAILQNKGVFRKYLKDHGYHVPEAVAYDNVAAALADRDRWEYPVIVKPTDSAGSKGVSRVEEPGKLEQAARMAVAYSIEGRMIIEQFIEQEGYASDSDSFSVDSELAFCSFNDQMFDADAQNPYAPAGFMWPSSMPEHAQDSLQSEIARLIRELKVGTAIYNIETRLGKDGNAYIMELSPRAGGNRLAEMLRYATGQNIILPTIQSALGLKLDPVPRQPQYEGYWGEAILHSRQEGIYEGITLSGDAKMCAVEVDMHVERGDRVHSFSSGRDEIGTLVLHSSSRDQLEGILKDIDQLAQIRVR